MSKKKDVFLYQSPMSDELTNKGFTHPTRFQKFRGEIIPDSFDLDVSEDEELKDGQVVGSTRFGQMLVWLHNMIITKG